MTYTVKVTMFLYVFALAIIGSGWTRFILPH